MAVQPRNALLCKTELIMSEFKRYYWDIELQEYTDRNGDECTYPAVVSDAAVARIAQLVAALLCRNCGALQTQCDHCDADLQSPERIALALETNGKSCSDARPQGQEDTVERTHPKATDQVGTVSVSGADKQPISPTSSNRGGKDG
jgi:hypothetical protein